MRAWALGALLAAAPAAASNYEVEELVDSISLREMQPLDAAFDLARRRALGAKPKTVMARPTLVDLHTHLFMEDGLGPLFNGQFESPLRADHWSDRFSSAINPATLGNSNLGIVVAALYAHPIFAPARKANIRAQIAKARAFAAKSPDWVIARTPSEARAAVLAGKGAIVLSLEGAGGILEGEADLVEFIDRGGISIVTFSHLTDDELGGAAFNGGFRKLGNPGAWLESLSDPREDEHGTSVNPQGLTKKGRDMALALMARRVWIDLSHTSEATEASLLPMLYRAGQPILYTHGVLRAHYDAERALSPRQLKRVKMTGGLVGLVPADELLGSTPVPKEMCPCPKGCRGGLYALAAQYRELARAVGPKAVMIATDFNGAMEHLQPSSCETGTSLDLEPGLYNIGQTPVLWSALRRAAPEAEASAFHGVDNFLAAWEKVRSP